MPRRLPSPHGVGGPRHWGLVTTWPPRLALAPGADPGLPPPRVGQQGTGGTFGGSPQTYLGAKSHRDGSGQRVQQQRQRRGQDPQHPQPRGVTGRPPRHATAGLCRGGGLRATLHTPGQLWDDELQMCGRSP